MKDIAKSMFNVLGEFKYLTALEKTGIIGIPAFIAFNAIAASTYGFSEAPSFSNLAHVASEMTRDFLPN